MTGTVVMLSGNRHMRGLKMPWGAWSGTRSPSSSNPRCRVLRSNKSGESLRCSSRNATLRDTGSGTRLRRRRNEWRERGDQLRQIVDDYLPDDVLIDSQIVVHDFVAHAHDFSP